MGIPFAKLHGAGNGYIAIDGREGPRNWPTLARTMTDPHFGVGSDGLVVVENSDIASLAMRVFNSDGSESEMSGNGIRLFAKFALDRGMAAVEGDLLTIETGGGVRSLWPRMRDGLVTGARVAMGAPTFDPVKIPAVSVTPMIEEVLAVGGEQFEVTCLAIGNPHAVAILEQDVDSFSLEEVGPLVQNHPSFPNRINFEIVNIMDENNLKVRVFERGEGETASSGTGSTASMIATRSLGRCADEVEVHLRGGSLRVAWPGAGEAYLEGPAVEVFSGVWPGDEG
jgi:diaminopimelate epimerase